MNTESLALPSIIVLVVLLIGSNVWWVYQSLQTGARLTYTEDELAVVRQTRGDLARLVPALDCRADSQTLNDRAGRILGPDALVSRRDGTLFINEVGFVIEGEVVRSIVFFGD